MILKIQALFRYRWDI